MIGWHRALAVLIVPVCIGTAQAQEPRVPQDGRIAVIGRARAETAPDFATVEIGVEAKGATPAAALDAAGAAARGIIALAAEFKVPDADIGTTAVTLQPITRTIRQSDGGMTEKPDGYRAANTVRIRLSDMARLGELMRRTLDSGANRIDGIGFGLRDPDAAESAVRMAAMKDARAQAENLAKAAGVMLGQVVSIQSPPPGNTQPYLAAAAPMRAKRGGAAVPLVAGSIETGAEVAATFAIAP